MIIEAVEFPLPRTADAVFLYVNPKGDTAFVQKIKKSGSVSIESDDFNTEFKTDREAAAFLKKFKWRFSGVE